MADAPYVTSMPRSETGTFPSFLTSRVMVSPSGETFVASRVREGFFI